MMKEMLIKRGYTQEEAEYFLESYKGEIKDESCILGEFRDFTELGVAYVDNQVESIDMMRDFIDYEGLGREIVKGDDSYIVLPSGCIVKVLLRKE